MTTSMSPNGQGRKTLAAQIDRLDRVLDGLAEGLNDAVAAVNVALLQYKDGASGGSQTIVIPAGIPIVAIEPGDSADLQPGVHVFVVARRNSEGAFTADRVLAGKNGLVPPM